MLIPSVPVLEENEIRHGCQFFNILVRALSKLPGGMNRFLPCGFGPHMSRLRHLGWNQCSHGLPSRPLESCHHQCLSAVCGVWGYPKGSAAGLPDGSLRFQCCTTVFTKQFFPWISPRLGRGVGNRSVVTSGRLLGSCDITLMSQRCVLGPGVGHAAGIYEDAQAFDEALPIDGATLALATTTLGHVLLAEHRLHHGWTWTWPANACLFLCCSRSRERTILLSKLLVGSRCLSRGWLDTHW